MIAAIKLFLCLSLCIILQVEVAYSGPSNSEHLCLRYYSSSHSLLVKSFQTLQRILVNRSAKKEANTYYEQAKLFAETYGYDFSQFVEQHIPKEGNTTIALIMGGSESLSILLKEYFKKRRLNHVQIKEVWLNRSITGVWKIERKTFMGYKNGRPRKVYGAIFPSYEQIPTYSYKYLVGGLDTPIPKLKANETLIEKHEAQNNITDLIDYTNQLELWQAENLLVIDTGFNGTIPSILASLAEKANYQGHLSSVMYAYNEGLTLNLNLPITGFTNALERKDDSLWAFSLDEGTEFLQVKNRYQNPSLLAYLEKNRINAFQRSRPKVTRLIYKDNQWQPDQAPYKDQQSLENHQKTREGILQGLKSRWPKFWDRFF